MLERLSRTRKGFCENGKRVPHPKRGSDYSSWLNQIELRLPRVNGRSSDHRFRSSADLFTPRTRFAGLAGLPLRPMPENIRHL